MDLICEGDERSPKRETLDGLEIVRIPIRHRRGGALSYAYQYSAFILVSAAILAWRSLRGRYDLVYVHNMPDILVVSALLPKLLGAKVILDQHDPMPELMTTIFNMDERSFRCPGDPLSGKVEHGTCRFGDHRQRRLQADFFRTQLPSRKDWRSDEFPR